MPIYHHFYVEVRTNAGWNAPLGFVPTEQSDLFLRPSRDPRRGQFAWAHPAIGWPSIFIGEQAIIPFRAGAPDDREGSSFFTYYDRQYRYDYSVNEDQICWIPYSHLLIDDWDQQTVLVGSSVGVAIAPVFGDGRQRFPRTLLAEDETRDIADVRRAAMLVGKPVDTAFGRERFRNAQLPMDSEVDVTWIQTIAEFIGTTWVTAFRELRNYGADDQLRVISVRG